MREFGGESSSSNTSSKARWLLLPSYTFLWSGAFGRRRRIVVVCHVDAFCATVELVGLFRARVLRPGARDLMCRARARVLMNFCACHLIQIGGRHRPALLDRALDAVIRLLPTSGRECRRNDPEMKLCYALFHRMFRNRIVAAGRNDQRHRDCLASDCHSVKPSAAAAEPE